MKALFKKLFRKNILHGNDATPVKKGYVCQICNREIDENAALTHIKTEEYLIGLIKKDHPEWKDDQNACPQCVAYYRELIKKAKI